MFSKGSNKGGPNSPSDHLPVPSTRKTMGRAAPSIISNDLVVIEKANFEGEIVAEECTIRGRVQGTVRARKVHLSGTCHMEGTILHESLAVEIGAFFEGNCRHCADPLAEVAGKPEPRTTFEPKRDLGTQAQAPAQPVQPAAGIFGRPGTTRTTSTGSLLGAIKSGQ
jgi:hypothetical protein